MNFTQKLILFSVGIVLVAVAFALLFKQAYTINTTGHDVYFLDQNLNGLLVLQFVVGWCLIIMCYPGKLRR